MKQEGKIVIGENYEALLYATEKRESFLFLQFVCVCVLKNDEEWATLNVRANIICKVTERVFVWISLSMFIMYSNWKIEVYGDGYIHKYICMCICACVCFVISHCSNEILHQYEWCTLFMPYCNWCTLTHNFFGVLFWVFCCCFYISPAFSTSHRIWIYFYDNMQLI